MPDITQRIPAVGMDASAPSRFAVGLVGEVGSGAPVYVGARLLAETKRSAHHGAHLSEDADPDDSLPGGITISARSVLAGSVEFFSDLHYSFVVPASTLRTIWDSFPDRRDPTLNKTSAEIRVNGSVFPAEVTLLPAPDHAGYDLVLYPMDEDTLAKPFSWAFGLTQFDVVLLFAWDQPMPYDLAHQVLRCDPVMVLQPEGESARRFLDMADKVAEGFPTWFAPAAPKTLVSDAGPGEFDGIFDAANTIIATYKRLLPWFRTSPRTKTRSALTLGSAEQMRSFTAATAAYIATHPDELMESAVDTGVRVGTRAFLPKRTLIDGTMQDRDTPENRVIVGFLMSVERKLTDVFHSASVKVDGVRTSHFMTRANTGAPDQRHMITETEHGRYVRGRAILEAFAAHEPTSDVETDALKLWFALQRTRELLRQLGGAFPFHIRPLPRMPQPSPIFERVGPYREIWHLMRAWFRSNLADEASQLSTVKENFKLETLNTPRLYERLVVTVLLEGLRGSGLTLNSVDMIHWPTHPVTSANRWIFVGETAMGSARVTLWYEPAIYAPGDEDRHGVELLRTTSWRLRPEGLIPGQPRSQLPRPPHYSPDIVILVETKATGTDESVEWTRTWLVGDAKLRKPSTAVQTEIVPAMLKYGVATRPMRPADRLECIRLMCAIPERNFNGMQLSDLAVGAGPDISVEVLTPDTLSTGLIEHVKALLGGEAPFGSRLGSDGAAFVGPTGSAQIRLAGGLGRD